MVLWINESSTIGILLQYATVNITGDLFIALFMLLAAFIAMVLAFKIPLEFASLLLMPVALGLVAYDTQFLPIGGIMLFIVAVSFAKAWLQN